MRGFGLADDLGNQRIDSRIQRVAGLVPAVQDARRELAACLVDLGDEIAAAQFEFEQQRIAGIAERLVKLFRPIRDAVDDVRGFLLEFRGNAIEPLVQHLMNAVGQIDEFVVNVTGLEVQARCQAFAGVQHRARGLVAGFFQPVEQVAAALAKGEDHVVARMAEGVRDVFAALFQRAGDAFGDFVDT